ncbi:PQQ-dependent sugar dehydrogenase [Candidatus Pelagibacter sp.]|nr:PQQ-dependent sugar dehydrogenase [Candidatus Pelagibacter sp.]
MLKNKKLIIALVILILFISSIFLIYKIDGVANLPKQHKHKLASDMLKIFMKLPDPIKSSLMIISGKRSFSNLFNDYNLKFLPETQYISIDFSRKKIKLDKQNRYTFYLETFKDKLIAITKTGVFYQSNLSELNTDKEDIDYTKLKIKNLFQKKGKIFDTLIVDNKVFVTKTSVYEDCERLEIYFAKIESVLNFDIFKSFDECISIGNGAGRIQRYNFNGDDGILLTTNDSDNDVPGSKAQNDKSIFGKIVFIDMIGKTHEIISKGHRNAQGLFVKDDIILSTEHGPKGGDEINRIFYKRNYGWPIASYGEPYKSKKLKYKKSHAKNNFEEPLHAFLPSIGISELILLPNTFNKKWTNSALVTSLNGRSIYRISFQDDKYNKILYIEKIYIGERIRDIKYVEKLNVIIIALETTGNIGVLKNIN